MLVRVSSLLRAPRAISSAQAETAALHGMFFLTGLGMVVLGPMLPAISLRWHLGDRDGGLLLGMQFLGTFTGSVTLGRDLRKNLFAGCLAIVLGFGGFALAASTATGFAAGACGIVLAGFGLGRTITSINLIAGARFVRHRAAALSLLNLTWGLGALACPIAAERTAERLGIAGLFVALSAVNAVGMAGGLLLVEHSFARESAPPNAIPGSAEPKNNGWKMACFAMAFCACGGAEASISGWASSLTTRSAGGTMHLGATVTTSLWTGMTAGRALAALVLLRAAEQRVLRGALAMAAVLTVLVLLPGAGGARLVLLVFAIGLTLAPVFPSLCSLLLAKQFSVGSNGRVMAATALGGAIFPWLVGVLSQRTGALRYGLWLPAALCVLLACLVPVLIAQPSVGGKSPDVAATSSAPQM